MWLLKFAFLVGFLKFSILKKITIGNARGCVDLAVVAINLLVLQFLDQFTPFTFHTLCDVKIISHF